MNSQKNIDTKYDELINSQKNTQAWLEYSPVCTKIVDLDFNLKYMSQAGIDAIGVEDITIFYNKSYPVEIYPQPYRDIWISCFQHAKNTGEVIAKDIIAIANDGHEIWFDSTFIPVKDDNGHLQYIIVTSEDITQRKEAEAQLKILNDNLEKRIKEEVEKNLKKDKQMIKQSRLAQMGEMISMIAHQWRQPLTAISSTAASVELKLILGNANNEEIKESIKNISSYTQHLSSTINDFRNFFKPSNKKITTILTKPIQNALSIIQASAISENIEFETDYNTPNEVKILENEIMQVILDILKNALDNFEEKKTKNPKIIIHTKNINNKSIIKISDNGGGIPENIIEEIFNPYFSTKKEKNGTGLGLYMSKTIIEEHHQGKLYVENNNKGAIFTIEL